MRPLLLVALLSMLAGCLGPPTPTQMDDRLDADGRPASAAASGELVDYWVNATLSMTHVRVDLPLGSFENTGGQNCLSFYNQELDVRGANITLTWSAPNPTLETLLLEFIRGRTGNRTTIAAAEGASPMRVTATDPPGVGEYLIAALPTGTSVSAGEELSLRVHFSIAGARNVAFPNLAACG